MQSCYKYTADTDNTGSYIRQLSLLLKIFLSSIELIDVPDNFLISGEVKGLLILLFKKPVNFGLRLAVLKFSQIFSLKSSTLY